MFWDHEELDDDVTTRTLEVIWNWMTCMVTLYHVTNNGPTSVHFLPQGAFQIWRQFDERICRNMNLQHNLKVFCTRVRVCLLKQTNSKEYKPKCKAKNRTATVPSSFLLNNKTRITVTVQIVFSFVLNTCLGDIMLCCCYLLKTWKPECLKTYIKL